MNYSLKDVRFVQVLNPRSQTYVKLDRQEGRIVSYHPRKETPYKGIEIIKREGFNV